MTESAKLQTPSASEPLLPWQLKFQSEGAETPEHDVVSMATKVPVGDVTRPHERRPPRFTPHTHHRSTELH